MKLIIDAGHGMNTAGKRSVNGMREYEFNRAVAFELKRLLEEYEDITVTYSHSDDRDVPLHKRVQIANDSNADLFVSIHANAHGNGREWTSAEGIETYVYVTKPKIAYELAKTVQARLIGRTLRKDRGVKAADFYILKKTRMPAILCECGFMTNKVEAGLLLTKSYRQACAKAITEGITDYFQLKRKTSIDHQANHSLYSVQVGTFTNTLDASTLLKNLQSHGYEGVIVTRK